MPVGFKQVDTFTEKQHPPEGFLDTQLVDMKFD